MRNQDKYPDLFRYYIARSLKLEYKGSKIHDTDMLFMFRLSLMDKLRGVNAFDLMAFDDVEGRMNRLQALGLISYVPVGRWSLTPEGEYFLLTLDKAIRDRVNLDNLELLTKKRIRGDKKIKKRYKRGA